ncbi:histidine kinase [Vallitalea longa]|uniref:histidine kinase n=1 Tax=Vallitalea longa TaxID=2936439 RepID=A0A9W5YFP1_9FIRM|nr:sensor histidine kinase [Vallitalea longa]GKX30343.1 histidine kinase [Vallitalea longa]
MHKIRRSFSLKLFICTAILTLIAILFISISSYNKYSISIMEQSSEKAQQIIELTSLNIETYLDDLYRLSLSPYYDQDVMDALDKSIDDSDLKSLYRTRTIEDFLEQILIIPRKDIIRVFILTDEIYKGERITSSIKPNQDFTEYPWYQEAMDKKKPIFVTAHLEQIIKNPKNIVFSIVSIVRSTRNTDKILGVIKVDANYSGISDICNKVDLGKDGGIIIVDNNEHVIFSNVPHLDCNNIHGMIEKTNDSKSPYTTASYDNNKYLINKKVIDYANWSVIGVTSLSTINKKILDVRNSAFIIALICFLISLILIIFYLKMSLRPLNNIITNIHKIQDGNLNVVFPIKTNDELGYLSNSLNKMVSELNKMFEENNTLVHQIYEAKYLQKEAQINTLFNQIQPHFIYNTLNMISMLVQCNNLTQAVTTINKLSIILRGLTHMDQEVKVSVELQLLDAYLTIQKNRFNDRLRYIIDIDDSLNDYIIPALLLQPVVENSVIHGCEAKKETTTIEITSSITEDNVIFLIKDNGVGMTEESLTKLRERLNSDNELNRTFDLSQKGNGIALINVNKRIKIKYGNEYRVEVDSTKGTGTIVKIILPKASI